MAAPLDASAEAPPRTSEARALLFAALVLLVGIALGAAGFFVERSMSTWRPEITRTASGWRIVQAHRAPLSAMALGGDNLVWGCGPSIVVMDLRSGRLKLLGPGPASRATWDPAASRRYVVWFEAEGTSAGEASAWVYDSATRRRRQLAALGSVLSLPSASGNLAAWCTTTQGRRRPSIVTVDITTGEAVRRGARVRRAGHRRRSRDLADATWARPGCRPRGRSSTSPRDAAGRWCRPRRCATPDFVGYDLSGRTLVWGQIDPASRRGRVVAQNVDDGAASVVAEVTDGAALSSAPAIDGDLVVWAETPATAGGSRVMGRRLGGGPAFLVRAVEGRVLSTAVSGDTVAWLAQRGQHHLHRDGEGAPMTAWTRRRTPLLGPFGVRVLLWLLVELWVLNVADLLLTRYSLCAGLRHGVQRRDGLLLPLGDGADGRLSRSAS